MFDIEREQGLFVVGKEFQGKQQFNGRDKSCLRSMLKDAYCDLTSVERSLSDVTSF